MLCALGFTLYAATKDRSQLYVPLILSRVTSVSGEEAASTLAGELLAAAMRVADDAAVLDLCVRYKPDFIALACVYVAGAGKGGGKDNPMRGIEGMWRDGEERRAWEDCVNR